MSHGAEGWLLGSGKGEAEWAGMQSLGERNSEASEKRHP